MFTDFDLSGAVQGVTGAVKGALDAVSEIASPAKLSDFFSPAKIGNGTRSGNKGTQQAEEAQRLDAGEDAELAAIDGALHSSGVGGLLALSPGSSTRKVPSPPLRKVPTPTRDDCKGYAAPLYAPSGLAPMGFHQV